MFLPKGWLKSTGWIKAQLLLRVCRDLLFSASPPLPPSSTLQIIDNWALMGRLAEGIRILGRMPLCPRCYTGMQGTLPAWLVPPSATTSAGNGVWGGSCGRGEAEQEAWLGIVQSWQAVLRNEIQKAAGFKEVGQLGLHSTWGFPSTAPPGSGLVRSILEWVG